MAKEVRVQTHSKSHKLLFEEKLQDSNGFVQSKEELYKSRPTMVPPSTKLKIRRISRLNSNFTENKIGEIEIDQVANELSNDFEIRQK